MQQNDMDTWESYAPEGLIKCPTCEDYTPVLYCFDDRWACAGCHIVACRARIDWLEREIREHINEQR